jgi:hypothetical protein
MISNVKYIPLHDRATCPNCKRPVPFGRWYIAADISNEFGTLRRADRERELLHELAWEFARRGRMHRGEAAAGQILVETPNGSTRKRAPLSHCRASISRDAARITSSPHRGLQILMHERR